MGNWIILYFRGERIASFPKSVENIAAVRLVFHVTDHATDTSGNLYWSILSVKQNRNRKKRSK